MASWKRIAFKSEARIIELEEKLSRSITWSDDDFENEASTQEEHDKDKQYGYYDRSRFNVAVLQMIRKYDSEYGITLETIRHYLREMCIDDKPDQWHYTWEEISIERAQELWDTESVFTYNIYEDVSSLQNGMDEEFIPEMLAQADYLFIENS
tara:strand:+ start:516 stop:974 length:459 start_codon:yes stop_codon:yes gene_type:complete